MNESIQAHLAEAISGDPTDFRYVEALTKTLARDNDFSCDEILAVVKDTAQMQRLGFISDVAHAYAQKLHLSDTENQILLKKLQDWREKQINLNPTKFCPFNYEFYLQEPNTYASYLLVESSYSEQDFFSKYT